MRGAGNPPRWVQSIFYHLCRNARHRPDWGSSALHDSLGSERAGHSVHWFRGWHSAYWHCYHSSSCWFSCWFFYHLATHPCSDGHRRPERIKLLTEIVGDMFFNNANSWNNAIYENMQSRKGWLRSFPVERKQAGRMRYFHNMYQPGIRRWVVRRA
jgi:hypothetical protein